MSLQTLNYLKYTSAGVLSSTITDVLALPRSGARSPSTFEGGRLTSEKQRWHLDASSLPDGFAPRIGDELLDADGVKWVITGWQDATLSTRWALDTERKA